MAKSDRLQAEQGHHKRAFELYYAQGTKRSYRSVGDEFGVSPSTVKLWSRSFRWKERIRERDAEAARKIADQSLQSRTGELGRNQRLVQMALVRVAKGIAEGKVRMQLGDLDRLIRLQDSLVGHPKELREAQTPQEIAAAIEAYFFSLDSETQDAVIAAFRGM